MKKIAMRVAFEWLDGDVWTAGLGYLKNILSALRTLPDGELQPILLTHSETDRDRCLKQLETFAPECCCLPAVSLTRWSPGWWNLQYQRLLRRGDTAPASAFDRFCAEYAIDMVFRLRLNVIRGTRTPQLAWIPDFQHVHLPEMFSEQEVEVRNRTFGAAARFANRVLLGSEDARKDFVNLFPKEADKARVLRFVSHISDRPPGPDEEDILRQYNLPAKFYFLPNQFWRHKNHEVVFRAVALLKEKGIDVTVVCTGHPYDFRAPAFAGDLLRSLSTLNIRDRVIILGLVPREHVFALMRQSVAVINASRFEGWSTSVEECKSLGKGMILSDLPVHREQDPPRVSYFDPGDAGQLGSVLHARWSSGNPGPDYELEETARAGFKRRQQNFARTLSELCNEVRSASEEPAASNVTAASLQFNG